MVLVTGGTGFLGAYIIKALIEKGYAVKAIQRKKDRPFFIPAPVVEKVQWVNGDILDPVFLEEVMENVDCIIHAAAYVSFQKSERHDMYTNNVQGTANLVNVALECNIPRFIHISSVATLGKSTDNKYINEGKQWEENKLTTHYAISKYFAEMEVWRAVGEGLQATVLNPSTILGYGNWNHSSCAIFKNCYTELPWYTNGINGFVDVEDVARLCVMFMESDFTAERFIISAENHSFRDIFNAIADGFSKKRPRLEASPFLAAIAWRLERVKTLISHKPSILTKETASIAQSLTFFDNSKILQSFPGFQFTPLQQTIRSACEAYLNSKQPV